jgi:hypothetical protein
MRRAVEAPAKAARGISRLFRKNMTISEIDHLFSDHFTYLDRVVSNRLPDHDQRQRGPVVMAFLELDRDLYFVHDVKAITCNAGMGAWVDYHIDDSNWIDDAARAFEAIGYGVVGHNLKECRKRYIAVGGNFENWDDRDLSKPVWDLEEPLMRALYDHLIARDFVFKKPSEE